MGYSGSIYIDKKCIYSEKKFTTEVCLHYGQAYLRQLWCEISKKELNEVLSELYFYDREAREIEYTIGLIYKLMYKFKSILSNQYNWNDDGILKDAVLVPSQNYKDEYELTVSFVRPDGTTGSHSLEDLVCCETEFVKIFGNKVGKHLFSDYVNKNNIYKKDYFIEIIELLSSKLEEKVNLWSKARPNTQTIYQLLLNLIEKIDNGDTIKIRFAPSQRNILQVASKNDGSITNYNVIDEFFLYNLFSKNELNSLYAIATITTKEQLGWLIYAFDYMEKKDRVSSFENTIKDLYNKLTTNTTNVVINASF